jgi:hypothetical protein
MFSAQARDIYCTIPVYIHYVMSHSQNIILDIYKQYINKKQRNVAAEYASLFLKTTDVAAAQLAQ